MAVALKGNKMSDSQIHIKGMFIGGEWLPSERTFDDINPSTGAIWAKVPEGGRTAARDAILAAQAAYPAWAALHFQDRAKILLKAADVWEARKMDYVAAAQAEGGGWFGKGMFEAGYVPEVFRAAAAMCYNAVGEILPSQHGKVSMAERVPMGVVSVISPWNMPGILTARGFAFPLAAGNTIVLKPSEDTPYAGGLFFAEVMEEAGIPKGVFNVVTCSRDRVSEVGDEMVENPLVKGISFTGSTPVGRQIAAKAGAHLKKACVELGGKDSLIVLDDADMDRATSAASFGSFMHQGQICMSVEKVLVHESIYADFLRQFVARAAKLKTGDTADKSNVIGPLINDRQVERVKFQIEDALAKGAKAALGGKVWDRFVEPTILTNVTPDMAVWQDETFGPVVVVVPFRTDAEAIALNNDTEYGLSSGIITADENRALEMSRKLETGMCHVNCSSVNDEPHVPFGGSKASGVGKHGGKWSMETFTETRWITLDRGGRPFPPVF
ncbi:MAG: aldehyde dehydrogenase (NAD+) [Celeribacter sp.]|jgi:aldehyde dehydrogenase (NAD+)